MQRILLLQQVSLSYWLQIGVGGTWALAHSIRRWRPGDHIKHTSSLLYGDAPDAAKNTGKMIKYGH